jgi:Holliday junction DNA helicase RuvA
MFNRITGTITGHDFPLLFVTTTGGIEWEFEVSALTFQEALASRETETHAILVHLHVREDILKLYGFWHSDERRAFRELLTVPGIGPRQALRILSGTTVRELTELLENEDVTALTRIPGLGRKTAQKLVLQLKGSLVTDGQSTGGGAAGSSAPEPYGELADALAEMGFDRAQAVTTLTRLAEDADDESPNEQDLFRRAIVALSGGA